jgi:hypothetical protein
MIYSGNIKEVSNTGKAFLMTGALTGYHLITIYTILIETI